MVTWREHERQVRRQDAIEGQFTRLERERLRALQGDIAAVKRAVERLVTAKDAGDGQPDWIECRKPKVAEAMLQGVHEWTLTYAEPLGVDLIGCWPWHPAAVALLLAAKGHHGAVMAGDRAADVTDYLVRMVPSVGKRIREIAGRCNDDQHGSAPHRWRPTGTTSTTWWGWPDGGQRTASACLRACRRGTN
jgi:hypothetical protein